MRSVRYTSRAGDPPAIFQKADCDPAQGLFERARCGAPGARGRLIEHYTPILRRRARGLMRLHHDDGALQAEDVVQDTLLSVLPHLPEFQPREYHRFQKYLGKTLKSKIIDNLRDRNHFLTEDDRVRARPDPAPDPYKSLELHEMLQLYKRALSGLSERTRLAVRLRCENGLPYKKVAEAIGGRSAHAARMLVSRALERIARTIGESQSGGRRPARPARRA